MSTLQTLDTGEVHACADKVPNHQDHDLRARGIHIDTDTMHALCGQVVVQMAASGQMRRADLSGGQCPLPVGVMPTWQTLGLLYHRIQWTPSLWGGGVLPHLSFLTSPWYRVEVVEMASVPKARSRANQ